MNRDFVVYIAGAITGGNAWLQEQNVRRAEGVYVALCLRGVSAICPHLHGRFLEGLLEHQAWLELDFPLLRRCDAVVLVEGWEGSKGTALEIAEAEVMGIPVWESVQDFVTWWETEGRKQGEDEPQITPMGTDFEAGRRAS